MKHSLRLIKKGDTILLKNYCWVVSYGIATGPVFKDEKREWRYVVHVDRWRSLNPNRVEDGIHSYGISQATEVGGSMSVVKKVRGDWARKILSRFNSDTGVFPKGTLACHDMAMISASFNSAPR